MADYDARQVALGRAVQIHEGTENDPAKIVETAKVFADFLDDDGTPDPLADALDHLLQSLKAAGWHSWRTRIDLGSLQIGGAPVGLGGIEEGSTDAKALAVVDALVQVAQVMLDTNPDHEPF